MVVLARVFTLSRDLILISIEFLYEYKFLAQNIAEFSLFHCKFVNFYRYKRRFNVEFGDKIMEKIYAREF